MITYNAEFYGVIPGEYCEKKLEEFLESIPKNDEEKVIKFREGDYLIDASNLKSRMLYITNTAGDKEYDDGEIPHESRSPLCFIGLKNVTVEGNGAKFIVFGKATNMVISECENITVKNLEIKVDNPHMHELKVIGKGRFYVDYEIDRQTEYESVGGKFYFTGQDYRCNFKEKSRISFWNAHIPAENTDQVERVRHPLRNCFKIKEISPYKIRAYSLSAQKFKIGDMYYIFDARRQYVGIFAENSKDIKIEKIKQRFSYSLAFVAQNCENITVSGVEFAPEKDSGRLMSSVADFIQICMCRGKTTVENSYFDGAGDDCLNIHGFHFKITEIKGNDLTVEFIHPQSHGFNPLRIGDEIAYIDPKNLLEQGKAKITDSELISETKIKLTVDNVSNATVGKVIEDASACSQLYFCGNTYTRIITRGLLITTREKAVVENNKFISNTMSGILLSDDASSWYESGMCRDVTIRNNEFGYCGENGILIKPENSIHSGAVHKNIKIIGNTFKKCEKACISIKSSSDIEIADNNIGEVPAKLKVSNTENIKSDI